MKKILFQSIDILRKTLIWRYPFNEVTLYFVPEKKLSTINYGLSTNWKCNSDANGKNNRM